MVEMFVIYRHVRYHIPGSNGTLVISLERPQCCSTFYKKGLPPQKLHIFPRFIRYHTLVQELTVCGASVAVTSQDHTSAMLLLLTRKV